MQPLKSRVLYSTEILSYTSFWFCSNKTFISSKTCRTRSSLGNTLKNKRPLLSDWSSGSTRRSRDGNRLETKLLFYCHWFILSMHLESYSYTRKETTEVLLDLNYLTSYLSKLPRFIKEEFSAASIIWLGAIYYWDTNATWTWRDSNCPSISSSHLIPSPWGRIRQSHPWSKTCTKSSNCQILFKFKERIVLSLSMYTQY